MRTLVAPLCLTLILGTPLHIRAASAAPASHPAADFVPAAPVEAPPEPLAAALASVRAGALAAHISFLASPGLEGRGLGTRGLDAAAEYVATTLALAGIPPLLTPAHDQPARAAYFQAVPLRQLSAVSGDVTIEVRHGDTVRSRTFHPGVDCLLPVMPAQTITAPAVFAGFGIREPALDRDDYKGLDVRGKIVVVLAGLPPGSKWDTPELRDKYAAEKPRHRYAAKLEALRSAHPAAVLAIEGDDWPSRLAPDEDADEGTFRSFDEVRQADDEPPLVQVSPVVGDAVLAALGLDHISAREARPAPLPGATVTVRISASERLITSRNVIATIPGADPSLAGEAVIVGAHMDHLGRKGNAIYPGADDNASGVASLLEIAKAFAASPQRPTRTLVFAFWTGEEEGKLGSGHFVRHPLWPLAKVATYVNLDMIGHPWLLDEIRTLVNDSPLPDGEAFLAHVKPSEFVEPGLPPHAPAIEAALRRAARETGLALHLDRTDGTHGGSDYRDFARADVPFIRFFGNFFPAYHEPGDTPEALDAAQVERVARLALATVWHLANP